MIRWLRLLSLAIAVGLGAGLGACLDEVPEELTAPLTVIPVPTNLRAVMSQDSTTLYWDADADFNFSGFSVYRREAEGVSWVKLGETPSSPFGDGSLRTGVVYMYKVAGLDSAGVEGTHSDLLLVKGAVFSVSINNGDEVTRRRSVVLLLSAPPLTQVVRFGEDPNLTDAQWMNYLSNYDYVLSPSDGSKVVYAQFTDEFGNLTDIVSGSIVLDTQASIDSLTFSPSSPVHPVTTLHFRIFTSGLETGGMVNINIPGIINDIVARDDGTEGDVLAGDGIYERDFTLPSSFRGIDVVLTAVFFDEAGNQSDEMEFPSPLDITDLPEAVRLFPVVDSTTNSITLRWTQSENDGFLSYDLYRDLTPGVTETRSTRVTSIMEAEGTSFTDNDVFEGETYWYAVFVLNDLQESVKSVNEREAHTDDIPPTPVVLDTLSSVGSDRVTLTWSRNEDTDFLEYRIYRTTSPGVVYGGGVLVGGLPITNRFDTYLDDTGPLALADSTYYYRVFVRDKGQKTTRSNEVSTE